MIHQQIKDLFFSSVDSVVSDISKYTFHPDSDFQRSRKIHVFSEPERGADAGFRKNLIPGD